MNLDRIIPALTLCCSECVRPSKASRQKQSCEQEGKIYTYTEAKTWRVSLYSTRYKVGCSCVERALPERFEGEAEAERNDGSPGARVDADSWTVDAERDIFLGDVARLTGEEGGVGVGESGGAISSMESSWSS